MAVAVVFVARKSNEVSKGVSLLAHLRPAWLGLAVALEAFSLWALARLQWVFLQAGHAHVGTGEMAELTAAHNAITMSVPGGVAWSTAFEYDQLRRRGVGRTLAGWSILSSGAVSSFCLFLLLAAGVEWASGGPATAAKAPVAFLCAIPPVVAGAVAVGRRRGLTGQDMAERLAGLLDRRVNKKAGAWVRKEVSELARFKPTPWQWARTFLLSVLNWMSDLGCLAACIISLGGHVPWPGVLIAYTLAKVAGILPITPGGLGVVEAGLSGLLVVYGMTSSRAIGSTILYRLISFWALLPVGWGYWGYLKLKTRGAGS